MLRTRIFMYTNNKYNVSVCIRVVLNLEKLWFLNIIEFMQRKKYLKTFTKWPQIDHELFSRIKKKIVQITRSKSLRLFVPPKGSKKPKSSKIRTILFSRFTLLYIRSEVEFIYLFYEIIRKVLFNANTKSNP